MKPDKPTSKERVQHVIEAIEAIQTFIAGHTEESLMKDLKTISACLYQFSIIGEATFHVESEVLKKYSYPWHKVKAFRNIILHEYFGIEMNVIWHTAIKILPELKQLMQEILKQEYS
jgi:uncharacterized protein with HEPN domain